MKRKDLEMLSKKQLIEMVKMFAGDRKRSFPVFTVRKNRAVEELLRICNATTERKRAEF